MLAAPQAGDEKRVLATIAFARALASNGDPAFAGEPIAIGPLSIDVQGHAVFSRGRQVALTRREFSLLVYLARQRGRVCSREQIVAQVWCNRALMSARTVDIHVHRVRAKLGEPCAELIETLRHVGYRLRVPSVTRRLPAITSS